MTTTTTRGGAWLIEDTTADAIFTPEQLTDEHRLIAQTADEFVRTRSRRRSIGSSRRTGRWRGSSSQRCGELGLLGTDVPEAFGGVALDKVSSIVVGEAVGRVASFATTFGAQTGLAITPLLCFGTDDAEARSTCRGWSRGEMIGAYALSESGSGLGRARREGARDAAAGRQLRR